MPIRGLRALQRRLNAAPRRVAREVGAELDDVASELLGRSQALVPELTRTLLISGEVQRLDGRDRLVRAVAFGSGRAEPYALIRHEDFYELGPISRLKSPTQDGPPGRKYLERPWAAMRDRVERRDIPRAILRGMRRR